MNTHLSSQEFVDALEDGLDVVRQHHLSACAACQTEVEALRAIVVDVETDAAAPEPSPLFWDHFQARVHAAVREESNAAVHASWWQTVVGSGTVRTWLTVGASMAVVVLMSAIYLREPASLSGGDTITQDGTAALAGDTEPLADGASTVNAAQWNFVSSMLASLEQDDVHQVLTPTNDGVDAAFQSLNERERQTFLRLLQAEIIAGLE